MADAQTEFTRLQNSIHDRFARLAASEALNLDVNPSNVNWGHVGVAADIDTQLELVCRMAAV